MWICYLDEDVCEYVGYVLFVVGDGFLFFDCYLFDVIEVDVDVLCDGENVYVVGIMEYIEEVGVYFGDSVCVLLFYILFLSIIGCFSEQMIVFVKVFNVLGLINI